MVVVVVVWLIRGNAKRESEGNAQVWWNWTTGRVMDMICNRRNEMVTSAHF